MFDKRKMNFWRLAFIFAGITILVLFFQWSSPKEQKATMMNVSMGQMMRNMQLSNLNIRDLVKGSEMTQSPSSTSNSASSLSNDGNSSSTSIHHDDENSKMVKMSFLTTAILFLLLPFIIGGSIILTIIWIR